MLFEVVNFRLSTKLKVTNRSDDFHFRSKDLKNHVKSNLIISCTCRAMGYGLRSNGLRIFRDGFGLYDALCGN